MKGTQPAGPGPPDVDRLNRAFAALADPTRRDIVARLTIGDATVGELAAPYDISLQAVSKHLRVLEEAGLVTRGRDAQRRPVHLEAATLGLMTEWIDHYRRLAEERYERLDALLAAMPHDPAGDPSAAAATEHTKPAPPERSTAHPTEGEPS